REFTGEEAAEYGLATFVEEDPLARAQAIAETIASRNPEAIRAAKRLMDTMLEGDTASILLAESEEQAKVIRRPNQVEAVMAGMQKRGPKFTDL
ncbi:MAG: enoyl-CoA hydratase, partial [Alphaproteobacteria bacterium]|nr:enoyl-CoA hydratase [Alphaproteobacteria bacterium]